MDLKRFEEILDAYGADPRRWPAQERPAAEAFLQQDEQARASMFAARQLDAALGASVQPLASARLREAILASAPRPARGRRLAVALGFAGEDLRRWLSGAALAASCACGIVFGFILVNASTADARADAVLAADAAALDAAATDTAALTELEGMV